MRLPSLECITCLSALAHNNNIWFKMNSFMRKGFSSSIKLAYVDLSTVPTPHLVSLISKLTLYILIDDVTGCDLVALLDNIQCERLIIKRQSLGKKETQALVRAMESRVKKVGIYNVELYMETIPEYSEQGSSLVLDYGTFEIATYVHYFKKTCVKEKTWICIGLLRLKTDEQCK